MYDVIWELAIGGIDSSIQGNGGEECMSVSHREKQKQHFIIFILVSSIMAKIFGVNCLHPTLILGSLYVDSTRLLIHTTSKKRVQICDTHSI